MKSRRELTMAAVVIGISAVTFGVVFWRSVSNPVNSVGDSLFFGCMAVIPAFVFALLAAGAIGKRVIRVTVRVPQSALDDGLTQAMWAAGFVFESERGSTLTFKQTGLQGLLSQTRLLVTKTSDGIVVGGESIHVEKAVRRLGGVIVSRE